MLPTSAFTPTSAAIPARPLLFARALCALLCGAPTASCPAAANAESEKVPMAIVAANMTVTATRLIVAIVRECKPYFLCTRRYLHLSDNCKSRFYYHFDVCKTRVMEK